MSPSAPPPASTPAVSTADSPPPIVSPGAPPQAKRSATVALNVVLAVIPIWIVAGMMVSIAPVAWNESSRQHAVRLGDGIDPAQAHDFDLIVEDLRRFHYETVTEGGRILNAIRKHPRSGLKRLTEWNRRWREDFERFGRTLGVPAPEDAHSGHENTANGGGAMVSETAGKNIDPRLQVKQLYHHVGTMQLQLVTLALSMAASLEDPLTGLRLPDHNAPSGALPPLPPGAPPVFRSP